MENEAENSTETNRALVSGSGRKGMATLQSTLREHMGKLGEGALGGLGPVVAVPGKMGFFLLLPFSHFWSFGGPLDLSQPLKLAIFSLVLRIARAFFFFFGEA